jgi:hypothetical protein
MTKKAIECNWVRSTVSTNHINRLIDNGLLSGTESCRVSKKDCPPKPKAGEVVIFSDHIERGFDPPGSKFFRDLLHFYGLHPQDLGSNSVVNISSFVVVCEAYLRIEPTVLLFRNLFYVNKQTETAQGRHQMLGGISFQRRRLTFFPSADLPSHPKGMPETWFYITTKVPDGQHPLPGFRPDRLDHKKEYPPRPTVTERIRLQPLMDKIAALMANGLTGADLILCWLSWRIQPLSFRDRLMYEYSGLEDPQRYNKEPAPVPDVVKQMRVIVNLPDDYTGEFSLRPFTSDNPPPAVSKILKMLQLLSYCLYS